MKKLVYSFLVTGISATLGISSLHAQTTFTNSNSRLTGTNLNSGGPVTIADWNNDGLDDIIRLNQGKDLFVEVQKTNGQYQTVSLGSFSTTTGWAWAMCAGDIDNNGYKDIAAAGYGPAVRIFKTNNTGTGATLVNVANSNFFAQNMTFADYNNDGWLDLFVCDDNAAAKILMNDGAGNLAVSNYINFMLNPGVTYGSDPADSGNYGSAYTDFDNDGDFDLYIAHCRQASSDTSGNDLRRINRLFVNNGNGTYTENAAAYNLNIKWQTWTSSFADFDNDGDQDVMLTNHDFRSMIMQNDGSGHYTEITLSTGFNTNGFLPLHSVAEDFDNDGYLDIFVTGHTHRLFKNNGNMTFTQVNGLFDNNSMLSFATGDANHDGFIDLYSSYGTGYTTPSNTSDVIWFNDGNSNHFFNVDLQGVISNRDAIGSKVTIYGPWGLKVREIRAGESYGTTNSAVAHFGLGTSSQIDSVVVNWPAGGRQVVNNPAADQFLTIIENTCVAPQAVVTASGPLSFCAGGSLTLSAPTGYNYLWSDGSTSTQSLLVSAAGEYNVKVISTSNPNCFAVSQTLVVVDSPDQTPSISAAGATTFCKGGSVELQGPAGFSSYSWTGGSTTQNATVSESGSYTLTIQGDCQAFTSAPIQVTVMAPTPPSSSDQYYTTPTSATLTAATGNNITWYDAPGGTVIGSGPSYTTPVLNTSTTYYMTSVDTFGGAMSATGMPYVSGANVYSGSGNTNGTLLFDVLDNCTLVSVKVYTDTPGDRKFLLRNSGGTVIDSALVTVSPDTQVVNLNWNLAPGTGYSIGTDAATNAAITGWAQNGPRFKRNNSGVAYPYTIPNLISITGSSSGANLYFYFYDWQVKAKEYVCTSDPVGVTVHITIDNTGVQTIEEGVVKIYPNPTSDVINVQTSLYDNMTLCIYDATGRLIENRRITSANTTIDIAGFASGIYQMKLRQGSKERNYKIVKK